MVGDGFGLIRKEGRNDQIKSLIGGIGGSEDSVSSPSLKGEQEKV